MAEKNRRFGYWRYYHLVHSRELQRVLEAIIVLVREAGEPWPKPTLMLRLRPAKLWPSLHQLLFSESILELVRRKYLQYPPSITSIGRVKYILYKAVVANSIWCIGLIFPKSFFTVDTHTAGEPTRIILFGYPIIKGKSIVEKIGTYKQEFDDLRKILLLEPRGHKDMVGAALIHPTETEADFGVIFMDSKGYQDMCGHGSIGIATAAIELGLVRTQEPITKVKLETLAGLINCAVRVREGKADEVSLENVPSFVYESNIKLDVPKIGKITIDISFGGNFFAQVESSQLKTELEMQNISRIIDRALAIRKECNRRVRVEHPELEHIKGIHQIQIYSKIGESPKTYKNIVVFGEGQVDRSPCGTGTSALMSLLYYKKELKIQEEIMNKSILDTMFRGKLLRLHRVKEFEAMVPQVTGSAYITGFHQFVVDPRDPLKNGFLL